MTEPPSKTQVFLARLAAVLAVGLFLVGVAWYGLSAEVEARFWHDIVDRPGGPMTFRFVLQPAMALLAALHDGIEDARRGRTPYLWALITGSRHRIERLEEGLIATARILLLGFGMDAIYQATVLKTFYPGEMAVVAVLLAFLPYLLLRGPIARIARRWMARGSGAAS
jgi:hypothetical protein